MSDRERTCCGFCCPHIEGTCPDFQSKAHESCIRRYEQDKAMGFTEEPWYNDHADTVDGDLEAARYHDEGW